MKIKNKIRSKSQSQSKKIGVTLRGPLYLFA